MSRSSVSRGFAGGRIECKPPGLSVKRRIVALGCFLLLMAGTSAVGAWAAREPVGEDIQEALRETGLDPARIVFPWRLTQEMKAWVLEKVTAKAGTEKRLRILLEALLEPEGLNLQYEAGYSGTAQEVFESRRGNCLGFATLAVAMSRELGINAYYLRVQGIDRYTREGDLIVVIDHVAAGYRLDGEPWILEFANDPSPHYRNLEPMSDLSALALYYSNRGAELLLEGDDRKARDWLEIGVELEPTRARIWTNLGVAQRRLGDLGAAERSYRQAAKVDPDHLPAYSNLLSLLRLEGGNDAGKELVRLLDRSKNRNPFVSLALGDLSSESGRQREARRFYRRAVVLGKGQAEPIAAMGRWLMKAGQTRKAEKWLHRAEAIDGESPRVRELRRQVHLAKANS